MVNWIGPSCVDLFSLEGRRKDRSNRKTRRRRRRRRSKQLLDDLEEKRG